MPFYTGTALWYSRKLAVIFSLQLFSLVGREIDRRGEFGLPAGKTRASLFAQGEKEQRSPVPKSEFIYLESCQQ